MSIEQKYSIIDQAELIVDGFAFIKEKENIKIINLNKKEPTVIYMSNKGKIFESSMDTIEQEIALKIWDKDKGYMEETYA